MRKIWRELENAETMGEQVSVTALLRAIAFGGGMDNAAFNKDANRLLVKRPSQDLRDFPSIILFPGGGQVTAKISLARDKAGQHLPGVIQYVNRQLVIDKTPLGVYTATLERNGQRYPVDLEKLR